MIYSEADAEAVGAAAEEVVVEVDFRAPRLVTLDPFLASKGKRSHSTKSCVPT